MMGSEMLAVIDNYDSFTYNLVHYLGELGAPARVYRNDKVTVAGVMAEAPRAILLSPGPRKPDEAGICLELIAAAAGRVPIFGVCLGLQAIGQAFGGKVVRAGRLMHGKVSAIRHDGAPLFAGIPARFEATRYHSLVVDRAALPDCLAVTAVDEDGVIMALSHKELPVHGVQFHPESIASEHGHDILRNFLALAARWHEQQAGAPAA